MTTDNGTWTNSPTTYTYAWFRDGTAISTATASTYVSVLADVGTSITCSVTATNASGSATATSNAIGPVTNPVPVTTVAPSITGTAANGQTLTARNGTWTNNPTLSRVWKRDGNTIAGQTAATYVCVFADVGSTITTTTTAVNAYGTATATSNGIGPIVNPTPANTAAPAISGTPANGSTITVSDGTWTNSPTLAYAWQRDGSAIPDATSNTYTVVSADIGTQITAVVTATNAYGTSSVTSRAVGPITNPVPANTVAPVVSGTTTVGSTLTTTNGTWTNSPTGYTYQWQRDGTNISGSTNSSRVLVAADNATNLTCVVTATNANGSALATSNALGPITTVAPVNTVAPTMSTTTNVGTVVTTTTGTWTGSPSYGYRWFIGGVAKSGATSSTYTPVAGDYGLTIFVRVTGTNAGGSASADSNSSIVSQPDPVNTAVPTITGTPQVGSTLTASNGTWQNSPSTYTYVWSASGAPISGANTASFTVTSAQLGSTLTVAVTATNLHGSATASSAATAAVTAASAAATWDPSSISPNLILSNSNRTVQWTGTGSALAAVAGTTQIPATGTWYFEVTTTTAAGTAVGFCNAAFLSGISTNTASNPAASANAIAWVSSTGQITYNGTNKVSVGTNGNGGLARFAINMDTKKLWCSNGTTTSSQWNGSNFNSVGGSGGVDLSGLGAGPFYVVGYLGTSGGNLLTRFKQSETGVTTGGSGGGYSWIGGA
ncbi:MULTISPECIES: hypothetical protein [unclassified Rhizobium]|uniref:beta strand repeat-containing protein n=1 Tax=unclassified Rhizobium TaxID=2613769 RepID=UPI00115DEDC9|nr:MULTISPECIES: hypothetical protein [unclassified Rhizobium]TQX90251.1 hypothetical protein EQW76_11145 [Rhizobium sp. rho-13.1]TQY16201.1 hypothetical protein EQW74_10735 [Rhizobium sp. rho-1.1]